RQAEVVDRHLIALFEGALLLRFLGLAIAELLQPRGPLALVRQPRFELLEHAPRVADDPDIDAAIPADLAGVAVDLDDARGFADARAIAEPEVERGADDEHHVGLAEGVLARVGEEIRVVMRQAAAPGAV